MLSIIVSRYQYSEDKADFIEEAATKMPEEYRSIFEKQTSFPAVNIGHLGVRKDMQSRGIGKQILDFILIGGLTNSTPATASPIRQIWI